MAWLLTIGGIMALIVLHELGHFAAAKAVGMRVERFSLFFPPRLFGVRRGETEYTIGAIPAGGYVKITGMTPEEVKTLPPEVARRAYYTQAPWRRVVVILAGPGVNLAIAFLLFWAVLLSGSLDGVATIENINPHVKGIQATSSVAAVERGSAAAGALRAGDRILAVDGRPASVAGVRAAIDAHRCAGKPTDGCRATTPAALTLERGGRRVQVSVAPRYDRRAGRMLLGFGFGARTRPIGALAGAGDALATMWVTTEGTVVGLAKALTDSKTRHELRSIVGITEATHQAVATGAGRALVVVGFVSLVLGVVNLLPFLPLDGGHVLWSLAEKVRRRRISPAAMWRFSSVGVLLLLFLVVNGFSNDIGRLGG